MPELPGLHNSCSLQEARDWLCISRSRCRSQRSLRLIYGCAFRLAASRHRNLHALSFDTNLPRQRYYVTCIRYQSSHLPVSKVRIQNPGANFRFLRQIFTVWLNTEPACIFLTLGTMKSQKTKSKNKIRLLWKIKNRLFDWDSNVWTWKTEKLSLLITLTTCWKMNCVKISNLNVRNRSKLVSTKRSIWIASSSCYDVLWKRPKLTWHVERINKSLVAINSIGTISHRFWRSKAYL